MSLIKEPVRLVIWDLDDTFWKGTVTEGGIKEIPTKHIELIKELNRRGIMSSICSKNDRKTVLKILNHLKIADQFVFVSIDWSAKGERISSIISETNLRTSSVMFIDDNPGNRGEATAINPGIQVEDENFIPNMLLDPRFVGKSDPQLTRLAQYKVLEAKAVDKINVLNSNEDFLRQSEIRLKIDYNIDDKLDRVIELINRTNQLNYTKVRLPENVEEAKAILRAQINDFNIQTGLVSVADKYGDYGEIGFFMLSSLHEVSADSRSRGQLLHYCFSCRTLGMLVEQWIYYFLGRPRLLTVGDVLTDLSTERQIDWFRLVDSLDIGTNEVQIDFPKVVLYGGCEANAIAVYMQAYTKELQAFGNYRVNGCFVRISSAIYALNMCNNDPNPISQVANKLNLPLHRVAHNLFYDAPEGTLFVFNCSSTDASGGQHLRHRENGLTLHIEPPMMPGFAFKTEPKQNVVAAIQESLPQLVDYVSNVHDYIGENFDLIDGISQQDLDAAMEALVNRVPKGCKFIILADHDHVRLAADVVQHLPWFTDYSNRMKSIASRYDYCDFVSFSDLIDDDGQIQMNGNHYDREIYLKMALRIREVALSLPGRELYRSDS